MEVKFVELWIQHDNTVFVDSNHQRNEEGPAQNSGGEGEGKEDLCQNVCMNIFSCGVPSDQYFMSTHQAAVRWREGGSFVFQLSSEVLQGNYLKVLIIFLHCNDCLNDVSGILEQRREKLMGCFLSESTVTSFSGNVCSTVSILYYDTAENSEINILKTSLFCF